MSAGGSGGGGYQCPHLSSTSVQYICFDPDLMPVSVFISQHVAAMTGERPTQSSVDFAAVILPTCYQVHH